MPKLPSLPRLPAGFPAVDLTKLDLSKIDLPKFDLPKIDLPNVDLPNVATDKVVAAARDAAYVTIGFGVLAFQQAQVRRRELESQLSGLATKVRSLVGAA
jgi:hypothetical protein